MTIAAQITGQLGSLTRSESRVAAHTLEHTHDVAFYTLDAFAQTVQVSTTTVLRFCRRLGFSGFSDFQEAVRREIRSQPDLMEKLQRTADGKAGNDLLSNILSRGLHCLRQTFRELPEDRLSQAVSRICSANRVFTFGMRESFALAHYAYTRFLTVRQDVFLLGSSNSADVEAVLSLTGQDVCIVYLFHRYTRQSLRMLELLKSRKIPVILITSEPYDPVEPLADILLLCHVDIGGIKNSAMAPVCLTDLMCNAVATADIQHSMDRMKACEALFRHAEIL